MKNSEESRKFHFPSESKQEGLEDGVSLLPDAMSSIISLVPLMHPTSLCTSLKSPELTRCEGRGRWRSKQREGVTRRKFLSCHPRILRFSSHYPSYL